MSKSSPKLNQKICHQTRSAARASARFSRGKDAQYAARKAEWIASHPNANCEEYEAAMFRLAKDCGV